MDCCLHLLECLASIEHVAGDVTWKIHDHEVNALVHENGNFNGVGAELSLVNDFHFRDDEEEPS